MLVGGVDVIDQGEGFRTGHNCKRLTVIYFRFYFFKRRLEQARRRAKFTSGVVGHRIDPQDNGGGS